MYGIEAEAESWVMSHLRISAGKIYRVPLEPRKRQTGFLLLRYQVALPPYTSLYSIYNIHLCIVENNLRIVTRTRWTPQWRTGIPIWFSMSSNIWTWRIWQHSVVHLDECTTWSINTVCYVVHNSSLSRHTTETSLPEQTLGIIHRDNVPTPNCIITPYQSYRDLRGSPYRSQPTALRLSRWVSRIDRLWRCMKYYKHPIRATPSC